MRNVVHVAIGDHIALATCDDGTLWRCSLASIALGEEEWTPVKTPPDGDPFPRAKDERRLTVVKDGAKTIVRGRNYVETEPSNE